MGSVSSWISIVLEMRGAAVATTVQMTTPSESTVPDLQAPGFWTMSHHAGHLGQNVTMVEAAPYPPLYNALARYLMLHGRNWGSVTLQAHQRWVNCSEHYRWRRCVLSFEHKISLTSVVGMLWFVPATLQSLLSKSSKLCSSTKTCRTQRTLRFVSTAANFVHVPPSVNVNPFTPETVRRSSELQWGNSFRGDDDEDNGRRYLLLCGQHFYSLMKALFILVTLWGHLLYCKIGCYHIKILYILSALKGLFCISG